MKTNYQKELSALLDSLPAGGTPKLLLHSCCGPCSSYVLEYLSRYFNITLLYYNPNIQPEEEFRKRLDCQKELLQKMELERPVKLMECNWRGEEFEKAVRGLEGEPEGGARCTVCFNLRLEETARLANEMGFDYFCTTLTLSPHKDAERINRIGAALAEKYGVKWLPSDFKKRDGYKRSIELSEKYGLYRQNWCGCRYSKRPESV